MPKSTFENCYTVEQVLREGSKLKTRFNRELFDWVPLEPIASYQVAEDPEAAAESTDLHELLLEAANRLGSAQKRAFLGKLEGLSINEMAEEFAVSGTAIRNALTDARYKVRSGVEKPLKDSLFDYYNSGPGEP